MPRLKSLRFSYLPALSGLAIVSGLVGAGWTLNASARQNRPPAAVPHSPSSALTVPVFQTTPQRPAADKPLAPPDSAPPSTPSKGKLRRPDIELYDTTIDQKTGLLTGRNFTYKEKEDSLVVTGMSVQYDQNKEVLDTRGDLVMDDPQHHVTGDKAHVERKNKLAVITGNVIIVLKPKQEPSSSTTDVVQTAAGQDNKQAVNKDRNRGGTITCDEVEDYYKREFAILRGHLVFKQQIIKKNGDKVERTLTADHAEYDGKANKMHLFSPVKAHDTDGQEIEFEKDAFVGTKEGEETLDSKGKVIIKALIEEEKDETEKKQPEKKAVTPPKAPK